MFDKSLILTILKQIDEALERIKSRAGEIVSADEFTIKLMIEELH